MVGNIGLGILSDPTRGERQNDVVLYGVSVARALTHAMEVVAEINGRANTRRGAPPPGTDTSGHIRAGLRYTHGSFRFDGAFISGLVAQQDASLGVTAGVTWVFKAIEIP